MDALRLEYDRFGPWVIRVSRDHPPPLLFMPHLSRSDDPLLALKIPRHIERRDARPGMDLYDYLICLYADDLVILQRVERDVRSWACRYRDVRQLRVTRNLLRGIIHLGLPGQSFDLPYNTVSDAEMLGMVAMIRERYERPRAGPEPPQEPVIPDGTLSFYFDRLRASERREHPERRLLAVQGTMKVAAQGSGLRRWALRAAGKRLLESMHSSDGHELMIRGRGQPYAYRWESVYGSDAWYIPLVGIREAGWREDAGNGAVELSIRTAAGLSHHVFASDNPSIAAYQAYLSGLVATASQQEEAA